MSASKNLQITLDKFRCVKILLESGATYSEITAMTGVSDVTIWRIKSAQTFEEYRNTMRAIYAARMAKDKKKAEAKAEALVEAEVKKQEAVAKQEAEEKLREEDRKAERINQGNTMSNNYQINRLIELVKEQNEILKLLSNKVAFIVEELTR